jgi:hypothetical protein
MSGNKSFSFIGNTSLKTIEWSNSYIKIEIKKTFLQIVSTKSMSDIETKSLVNIKMRRSYKT